MLPRICHRCVSYASSLCRTSKQFALDSCHRNVAYSDLIKAGSILQDRKFASKTISNSRPDDSNKQEVESRDDVSPQHDDELQKFLDEIKKDFDAHPDVKESGNQTIGGNTEDSSDKPSKLSSEEFTSLPLSIRERFEPYKDDDSTIIRSAEEVPKQVSSWKQKVIEVEEEQEVYLYQQKPDKIDYTSFERGKTGVFDIEQLIKILKQESMQDVAVIRIPPSLHYCDYMTLATAKSPRHLQAVADFIRRLHKKKKYADEPFLKIEGEDSRVWKVIDMGQIVLHLFLPEAREVYDIETLWTVGQKYDPLSNQKADPYEDLLKEHMVFLQNAKPLFDTK